ncbi:MAG: DeoR/GlpR family DNA-binding transcription regulator [Rhodothalassiaceae bacterium]
MRFNARQKQILEVASRDGMVSIEALAHEFKVTPQTLRRDLNWLCDQNLLVRHHGGASLPNSVRNLRYDIRKNSLSVEKQAIARCLVDQVPDHASLFINIGTTTEAVARELARRRHGLHVVTNNLNVAMLLAEQPDFEIVVTGGVVRTRDFGIVGQAALDMIKHFRVDVGIIGISGIDLDGTLLDFDHREVMIAQAIIDNSRKVFLAADHSKFGRSAMVRVGHVGRIAALFTDQAPPRELAEALAAANTAVHIADVQHRSENA